MGELIGPILFHGVCALLLVGLVIGFFFARRWTRGFRVGHQQAERDFAARHGLEQVAPGHLRGVVGGTRVELDAPRLAVRGVSSGRVGMVAALRARVQTSPGPAWTLCQRSLAERLHQPLPALGQPVLLGQPALDELWTLQAEPGAVTPAPALLNQLTDAGLRYVLCRDGGLAAWFDSETQHDDLLGSAERLERLLILSRAMAQPLSAGRDGPA
jgi:hypothetical protein